MRVAALALLGTALAAELKVCSQIDFTQEGVSTLSKDGAEYYAVALLHGYCGYCKSQARAMVGYYNALSDEARAQVGIMFINRATIERNLKDLQTIADAANDKDVVVVQDTGSWDDSVLFDRISGNDSSPKDDIAIVDKYGRLIQYFQSQQSNWRVGNVPRKLDEVLKSDFENPCGAMDDKDDEGKDDTKDDDKECTRTGKVLGTKVKKKTKQDDACACGLQCEADGHAGYAFKAGKMKKGKMKKGKCTCYSEVRNTKDKGSLFIGVFEEE